MQSETHPKSTLIQLGLNPGLRITKPMFFKTIQREEHGLAWAKPARCPCPGHMECPEMTWQSRLAG